MNDEPRLVMRRWLWMVACTVLLASSCGGCNEKTGKSNGTENNMMAESCDDLECSEDASCDDSDGTASCTCRPGFEGNGFVCEEITVACGDDSECGDNGTCTGGFCECAEGYALDADGCRDADECGTNTDDCDENATCTNTPGSFLCSCDIGYEGDGKTCSDFDECAAEADDCDGEHAVCSNVDGGFECACESGYTGDGSTCSILVDCNADPDACDPNASCTDTPDGTACVCDEGFAGDGANCRQTGFTVLEAGNNLNCGLRRDGTMSCWGANAPGAESIPFYGRVATTPTDEPTGATWSHLGSGFSNWCAVLEADTTLWCLEGVALQQVGTETGWESSAGSTDFFDASRCAIKTDGTLWCWGDNDGYQLGLGEDPGDTTLPLQVGADTDWATVALGEDHTCAIKTNGTLWCWGDDRTLVSRESAPLQISPDTDWESLSLYGNETCAIKTNGQVWCAGRFSDDQLQRVEPVIWKAYDTVQGRSCGVRDDGSLWCRGAGQLGENGSTSINEFNFVQVGNATDWSSVTLGLQHSCGLKESGDAWCWGSNLAGALGIGGLPLRYEPTRIDAGVAYQSVAGGIASTCAVRANGAIACTGANFARQALLPETTYAAQEFTQVGNSTDWAQLVGGMQHFCVTQNNGSLWCGGFNGTGQTGLGMSNFPVGLSRVGSDTDWDVIAAGDFWTYGIKTDGSLYAWGANMTGQLGLGDTDNRFSPTLVGSANWKQLDSGGNTSGNGHACGIQDDDTLWCWGNNDQGQLGLGTMDNVLVPTQVGDQSWDSVKVGGTVSCAIDPDGALWCSGRGPGWLQQTTLTQVGSDTDWDTVAIGQFHVCGIKNGGTLWCWGQNAYGILGIGSQQSTVQSSPAQVGSSSDWTALGLGARSTHAVRSDGSLWAWGSNDSGQLGTGDGWSHEPLPVMD